MEMVQQSRKRIAYYFAWPDQEILDERIISLSCDEETWLYKMKDASFNGDSESFFHHGLSLQNKHSLTATGGSVDSRTFTRRKHGPLRPSLDLLVESPLSNNRSSLGLLSSSALLNISLTEKHTQKSGNQEKTSSSSTVSETLPTNRVFKLDSPLINSSALERNGQLSAKHPIFDRLRFDSESSDSSILPSLENFCPFEKNDAMTDSLLVFLEKEVACCPPTEFQDDSRMVDSLVSLKSDHDPHSILYTNGKSELMTDSLVNFLGPVDCKPPSGFEDNDMSNSVVNIKESDVLPSCDMTSSVLDYLENVRPAGSLVESTLSETENIPPNNCDNTDNLNYNRIQPHSGRTSILNSTYELEGIDVVKVSDANEPNNTVNITFTKSVSLNNDLQDNKDVISSDANKCSETANITFTNTVNISKRSKVNGETVQSFQSNKHIPFTTESIQINNNNGRNLKTDTRSKESNIIEGHKNELKKLRSCELLTDEHSYTNYDSQRINRTLTKSELLETLNSSRQIPLRNSTFNTTFTKLKPSSKNSTFVKSSDGLNGGLEDDQTSSASDSSFSSGSTKPRSFDELQTIALQQERSLDNQSTPTDTMLAKLNIELSPIRRVSSIPGRSSESRSANCSPVRSSTQRPLHPHPISRLNQPTLDTRRHMHTSSLMNIARPQVSGLRLPQPLSRTSTIQKTVIRPITAPTLAATGIPRPQASRLPMPRFRGSGIPGLKPRGRFH